LEEEKLREEKLEAYNKKAEQIKLRIKTHHNNFMTEQEMSDRHSPEDFEAGVYQSAVDYNTELEIQEKIRNFEEKMMRATMNRKNRIQESQERLQYQHESVRTRLSHKGSSDHHKIYDTLQRYCERQVKSRKTVKKKIETRDENIQWKRHKDSEKDNMRRMRLKEQLA
jgi:hypothetical protein